MSERLIVEFLVSFYVPLRTHTHTHTLTRSLLVCSVLLCYIYIFTPLLARFLFAACAIYFVAFDIFICHHQQTTNNNTTQHNK